jgi:GH25 family lysozyme M1 (1,4-beta-N-acetylmuramidase)
MQEYAAILDLSYYQGTIDFRALKAAGVQGVILRVSDGLFVDPNFGTYAAEAHGVDFEYGVGFYQFSRMWAIYNQPPYTPEGQAQLAIDQVRATGQPFRLGGMADWEASGAQWWGPAEADRYFAVMDSFVPDFPKALGEYNGCAIYSAAWWWNPHVVMPEHYANRRFILAQYPFSHNLQPPQDVTKWSEWAFGGSPPGPTLPAGIKDWWGWQFSSYGNVPGVLTNADCNIVKLAPSKPKEDMAYLIKLATSDEVDITDGVTARRHISPEEYADWSQILGGARVVSQATWDGIPVYAPDAPNPVVHLSGTWSTA